MLTRELRSHVVGIAFSLAATVGAFGGQQATEPERPGPRPSPGGAVILRYECLKWTASKPTNDQFVQSEVTVSPYFLFRKDRNSFDKWTVVCESSPELPAGVVPPTNLVWSGTDAENSRDWVVKEVSYAVHMAVKNGALDGLLQQQAAKDVKDMQAKFKETIDRLEKRVSELEGKSAKPPTKAPAPATKATPAVKVQ
jgi:hypothetical protein